MPILIDGHNLIGRLPGLSLADPDDEEKLVRLLQPFQARRKSSLVVVFDPGITFLPAQKRRRGRIQVIYAPSGSSADEVIARRVAASRNPSEWLVVTNDQALASRVRRFGARVQSADDLVAALEASPGAEADWKDREPSPDEVDYWLGQFQQRRKRQS